MNKFKKSVVFTIILCTLLSSIVGCDKTNNIDTETISAVIQSDITNEHVTNESNTDKITTQPNEIYTFEISLDHICLPYLELYNEFQTRTKNNTYDKWLETKLKEGTESHIAIYEKYIEMWRDELSFTIQTGEVLFADSSQYDDWKNRINDWFDSMYHLIETEFKLIGYDEPGKLIVISTHAISIRQKVLDTKYFLYQKAYDSLDIDNEDYTIFRDDYINLDIYWSSNIYLLENEIANSTPLNHIAPLGVSRDVCELLEYFDNNANNNIFDRTLDSHLTVNFFPEQSDNPAEDLRYIYNSELDAWKIELEFTIRTAEKHFKSSADFEEWKSAIQNLQAKTYTLFLSELLNGSHLDEKSIYYFYLFRQQVINTKKFAFYLEFMNLVSSGAENIVVPIEWSPK